jgi:ribosomal protein L23
MPTKQNIVHFPEMALTLVRRASAKLPYNHFVFRTEPKWTKFEIKEYLEKVYNVKVDSITTNISQGKLPT